MNDDSRSPQTDEPEPREGIYRREAVEAAQAPKRQYGDVLRIAPIWLRAAYWVIAGFIVTVITVATFARVNEYSRGAAVIAALSRMVVTSRAAGHVVTLAVAPGQLVREGQVLLRLNDEEEKAELARLDNEVDRQLARARAEPGDVSITQVLVEVRAQRALAQVKLDERAIRAPIAGRISHVRTREGQDLAAGAPVITLLEPNPRFRVLALLPGASLPQIHPGMPLRVELVGYAYAYQTARVFDVSQQVVGPSEARRFLGPDVADSVAIEGPVTLVQADLEGASFEVDGQTLNYHDGMPAYAEVPIRQVRLVVMLAPWLRRLF